MTDIVERLHKHADIFEDIEGDLMREAADEITRLRAAIDTSIGDLLREDMDNAYVVLWRSRQPLPSPPTQEGGE